MISLRIVIVLLLVHGIRGFTLFASSSVPLNIVPQDNATSPVTVNFNATEPKMIVSFVNGIFHTLDDWIRISNQLKETFNAEVKPFYNPTTGYWVKDAAAAGYELLRRSNDFVAAKDLAKHLRNLLSEVGPEGRVLHIAHSGGAILTYLAGRHHLTHSERNQIDIITFGAGHSISHKYFKGYVRNYYAKNDPVMTVDTQAKKLYYQFASCPSAAVVPRIHMVESAYNTSFYFLTGLTGSAIKDHSMEEPTYRQVLLEEAKEFEVRKQRLRAGVNQRRRRRWHTSWRKRAARITGWHHFWGRVPPKPTDIIRDYAKLTATIPSALVNYPDSNSQLTTTLFRKTRKAFARWTGMHRAFSKGIKKNGVMLELAAGNATLPLMTMNGTNKQPQLQQINQLSPVPTVTLRENKTSPFTQFSTGLSDGLEQLEYLVHSTNVSDWWQSLSNSTSQFLHWSQPAREYVTTSLVSDVTTSVATGVSSGWSAIASLCFGKTNSTDNVATTATSVATLHQREFNFSLTVEDIELPVQFRLMLLTSAQRHCFKMFANTSTRGSVQNRQQLEEDLLQIWHRKANLAKLLTAAEAPHARQKVSYVSCILGDCLASATEGLAVVNKTLNAVVPAFLSEEEANEVVEVVHRLLLTNGNTTNAQVNITAVNDDCFGGAGSDSDVAYCCIQDARILASVNVQDLLDRELRSQKTVTGSNNTSSSNSSSSSSDSNSAEQMLDTWESLLRTECGRLLLRQKRDLNRANRREQYLEDLLSSQRWTLDVE